MERRRKRKSFKSNIFFSLLLLYYLQGGRNTAFCHIWKNERIIGQGRSTEKSKSQKPNFAVERFCIISLKGYCDFLKSILCKPFKGNIESQDDDQDDDDDRSCSFYYYYS